jgi:hypothetical protein
VATPLSLVEWFQDFYAEAQAGAVRPVEGVVRAGELLFVPRGWWHLAMNLEVRSRGRAGRLCGVGRRACAWQHGVARGPVARLRTQGSSRTSIEKYPHRRHVRDVCTPCVWLQYKALAVSSSQHLLTACDKSACLTVAVPTPRRSRAPLAHAERHKP